MYVESRGVDIDGTEHYVRSWTLYNTAPDAERLLQEKRVASLASAYLTGFLSTVLHFHK